MTSFQKNVIFIAATVLVLLIVCFSAYLGIQNHTQSVARKAQQLAEQREAWKKENVRNLKELSFIGALSTDEQTRVDNAGDDLERLQQVLLDIHQERINFWANLLEDATKRRVKLEQSGLLEYAAYSSEVREVQASIADDTKKAVENVSGYNEAKQRIQEWRPSDFTTYQNQAPDQKHVAVEDKPAPGVSANSGELGESAVRPLKFASASSPAETHAETALEHVDVNVSIALNGWAHAIETNDPTQIASFYTNDVNRFFLKLHVSRQFVQGYWQDWFSAHDTRVTKFKLNDITLENETFDTAEVRFTEDVMTATRGENSERLTRSRVYLKKEDGSWKISSEQDFK